MVFLEVNLEIIGTMFSKLFSFAFAKHVGKFMVVGGNVLKFHWRIFWKVGDVGSLGRCFWRRQMKTERDRSREFADTCKSSGANQRDLWRGWGKG
jgi:hypothetical protein